MLPVMFLARKLDGEDPFVIYWLRIAYCCMQLLCVAAVMYTYYKASAAQASIGFQVVYVPPAATVSITTCTSY